jgi:hypothetical protein
VPFRYALKEGGAYTYCSCDHEPVIDAHAKFGLRPHKNSRSDKEKHSDGGRVDHSLNRRFDALGIVVVWSRPCRYDLWRGRTHFGAVSKRPKIFRRSVEYVKMRELSQVEVLESSQ